MDNQLPTTPPNPVGPNPVSPLGASPLGGSGFGRSPLGKSPLGGGGGGTLMYALIGILGVGALVFAVLAVTFYQKATVATTTLDQQKATAVTKAKAEQQKADEAAYTIANESPFRSYVAPTEFGSFEIKFPKDWSGYVSQQKTGTQVDLIINPDFVRRTDNQDELSATRITLQERTSDQFMQTFTSQLKRGTVKQTTISISGQKAYDLTGQFQDKRTTREVVVPVRDKVIVFINENSKYAKEFNEILAQSKIIP